MSINTSPARDPFYTAWIGMRGRCNNPRNPKYRYYGGRGIRVESCWDSFETFRDDMGPKPTSSHSLDRIDPNANYGPKNCRWATKAVQMQNRRNCVFTPDCIRSIRVAYESGETQVSIAARYGVRSGDISNICLRKVWKNIV